MPTADRLRRWLDKQVQPILDQTEVYSGCYGRISVNFYGYNSNGNRGVAAGLGNIQKLKDGEALSSRTNAEDDFEAVEDEISSVNDKGGVCRPYIEELF